MEEDILISSRSYMDKKDLDQYEKLLLQMCNNVRVFNANGIPLWHDTNYFTCKKTNGNIMIEYMLFSKGILNHIH